MKASGLLLKFERRWIPALPVCDQAKTYAIKLPAVFTPILMLVLTMVLSVCCCSAENLLWRKVDQRLTTDPVKRGTHRTRPWTRLNSLFARLRESWLWYDRTFMMCPLITFSIWTSKLSKIFLDVWHLCILCSKCMLVSSILAISIDLNFAGKSRTTWGQSDVRRVRR